MEQQTVKRNVTNYFQAEMMLSSVLRMYNQRQCRLCYIRAIERLVAMMCRNTWLVRFGRRVPSFHTYTEWSAARSARPGFYQLSIRCKSAVIPLRQAGRRKLSAWDRNFSKSERLFRSTWNFVHTFKTHIQVYPASLKKKKFFLREIRRVEVSVNQKKINKMKSRH